MTNNWVHITMTVTRHAVSVFVNGDRVPDSVSRLPAMCFPVTRNSKSTHHT